MHQILKTLQIKRYYSINSNLINLLKTMPKEQTHIAEVQKQRKKIKEKSNKYSPGRVTLQVLGTGARGAPASLYVFSDQSRYLFNCGEGTQRLSHEHRLKLAKLEHIFITQPTWKNIGGLPGTALTIQDVGVPEVTLHGPQGLEELFTATHRFIVIKDLQIKIAECTANSTFEDNVMKVTYVPITRGNGINQTNGLGSSSSQSNGETTIEDDNVDYYAYECSGKRKTPLQNLTPTQQLLLQSTKDKRASIAYICRLQPRPGALCLDKCVNFGVPPGPLLGKLKSGEDVTLPNGNLVKASDVCEPDDPGPVFIVVECPTEEYLDSLLENESFKLHQTLAKKNNDLASLVVHFTPKSVINHPKYKQWVEKFASTTQHLVLNDSNSCMGSLAVHRIQYQLNLLSTDIFPLLNDNGTEIILENDSNILPAIKKIKCETTNLAIDQLSVKSRPSSPLEPYIYPSTLFSYHLRPRNGTDRSAEIKIIPQQYIEEITIMETFPNVLNELKQQLQHKFNELNLIKQYPKLLFLGTGSSIPNKTRNTSGILLQLAEDNNILMDCGEGTYGQLVRFFGHENVDKILLNIKAIYISHLHADHHLGLIGLLQGRRKAIKNLSVDYINPILLFAPKQIIWWLNFYDRCFENISQEYELIFNSDLILNKHELATDKENLIYDTLHMNSINTCYVRHCPNAFGVNFSHKSGYQVTYSGDTMPSENLIELGQNCDVLIHEATMEDELSKEAVIKMHSTTSQAIEIGRKMNAKYILLTHFSQRYAKLPRFNENFTDNVGIAFDNMHIHLDALPLLPLLYPALKLMFAEHYEELEHKAVKRQMRIERENNADVLEEITS